MTHATNQQTRLVMHAHLRKKELSREIACSPSEGRVPLMELKGSSSSTMNKINWSNTYQFLKTIEQLAAGSVLFLVDWRAGVNFRILTRNGETRVVGSTHVEMKARTLRTVPGRCQQMIDNHFDLCFQELVSILHNPTILQSCSWIVVARRTDIIIFILKKSKQKA